MALVFEGRRRCVYAQGGSEQRLRRTLPKVSEKLIILDHSSDLQAMDAVSLY
jgi:hypothetical protein